ncbi:MAG TPA: hypothetical protein VLH79_02450 [Chthonomonadales bacterium]|nr:hypothetical protein [Chthonomonadales bacterium]
MLYTPFDFNEAIGHRQEYVEDRLRDGSPVVGLSYDEGLLLLTVTLSQRKIFEIYDRLLYSAIGNQSDVEAIRVAAVDVAHREGYDRSPDDVTAHRLVGFALSPPVKRLFGDQVNAPAVVRAIFGELGAAPPDDAFYVLNYDGEFRRSSPWAVVAGTTEAEQRAGELLAEAAHPLGRREALSLALRAWSVGAAAGRRPPKDEPDEADPGGLADRAAALLREQLDLGRIEVGLLDRLTRRDARYSALPDEEIASLAAEVR